MLTTQVLLEPLASSINYTPSRAVDLLSLATWFSASSAPDHQSFAVASL